MRCFRFLTLAAVLFASGGVSHADDFKLTSNQRISCSRGLSPGKLATATCRTYAYLFNTRTSDYFRCTMTLAMTRDAKEVVNVQADGSCVKKGRVFDADGSYNFDIAETEPPNTNSFFGAGGTALWASDTASRKMRACVTIPSGFGNDVVSRCLDMAFD